MSQLINGHFVVSQGAVAVCLHCGRRDVALGKYRYYEFHNSPCQERHKRFLDEPLPEHTHEIGGES